VVNLALHNLVHPPTILCGLPSSVVTEHENLEPHEETGFAVWNGGRDGLAELLEQHSEAWVQDVASNDPVSGTRHLNLSGKVIVDYCAGSGTKTQQLALMHPKAQIVATDVDARRFILLGQRFQDSERVKVVKWDQISEYLGKTSLLLLDVPCSNSAVLARRVEARYRLDEKHLDDLVRVQRRIIKDSMALLTSGGSVLYSTCSLEGEENEAQARWLSKRYRIKIRSERSRWPMGVPGGRSTRYSDGGFFALLG